MDVATYPPELAIRFAYLAVAMNKAGTKIYQSDKNFLFQALPANDFPGKTELVIAMREI
jgi:hypothetical protein